MKTLSERFDPRATAFLLAAIFGFAGPAQAQVTCAVNAQTGRLEAALAWRNSLGAERANAMCQSLQVNPVSAMTGLPTSRGTAVPTPAALPMLPSTPSSAGRAGLESDDVTQPEAMAREMIQRMDARHSGAASSTSGRAVVVPANAPAVAPLDAALPKTDGVLGAGTSAQMPLAPVVAPSATGFAIAPQDRTFREVLGKWSSAAGWSFAPEHWALQRDIPVSGADVLTGDFKTAVRTLLRASLMSDTPARPCFYSNNVLRVIPASELCKRTDL